MISAAAAAGRTGGLPPTLPSVPNALARGSALRVAVILFLASLATSASFIQTVENPNSSARMFLIYALLERGELDITPHGHLTIDKSVSGDKVYLDKAPGMSFLALPAVYLTWQLTEEPRTIKSLSLQRRGWPSSFEERTYVATVSTSGLFTAAAVALLYLGLLVLFSSGSGAAIAAITFGFATPLLGWATAFFGHAAAASLLVYAFTSAVFLCRVPHTGRRAIVLASLCGLSAAAAIAVDYTTAPAAAAIAIWVLSELRGTLARQWPVLLAACVGGGAVLSLCLWYNSAAFGSPWSLGYGDAPDFPEMRRGFFGVDLPKLSVAGELLAGQSRGILWVSPIMVLVPLGIWALLRRAGLRSVAVLAGLIIAYHFFLNAGMYYWEGGRSTGPRYLTAMLPFSAVAIGALWNSGSRIARATLLVLLVASALLSLATAMAGMFMPQEEESSLLRYIVHQAIRLDPDTFVGSRLGLSPGLLLAGLTGIWAVAAVLLIKAFRCQAATEGHE